MTDKFATALDEVLTLRSENAGLLEELRAVKRTLWGVVNGVGVGGGVLLFRRDLEAYPGDDMAVLETTDDPATGNVKFQALSRRKR